ncbi:MAG: flagellar brake protein [Lachnospiraceae bacterium]|nr:flagellar brake protein [Lachnospiraceae bacterium]
MNNKIGIGDKLELEKIETGLLASFEKEPKIYASQVLDEAPEGDMFVSMPIQGGKVIPLNVGEEFYATFYSKSGMLRCQVQVTGRYKKESLYLLKLAFMTELEKVQRREYYRLSCHLPLIYRIIEADERNLLEEDIPYDDEEMVMNWQNGEILDLSGGGIRFITPFEIPRHTLLQVRFDISLGEETEVMYAYAVLLRAERSPNNSAIYDSRIKFWRMDRVTREKIVRFIFETQRKKRSREAGKIG